MVSVASVRQSFLIGPKHMKSPSQSHQSGQVWVGTLELCTPGSRPCMLAIDVSCCLAHARVHGTVLAGGALDGLGQARSDFCNDTRNPTAPHCPWLAAF